MNHRVAQLTTASAGLALILLASGASTPVRLQAAEPPAAAAAQNNPSKVPDLSGDWTPDPKRGGFGQSFSLSDMGGRKRGQEDDIPYQPWAREKTLSEKPSTGPNPFFGETTDPQVLYC